MIYYSVGSHSADASHHALVIYFFSCLILKACASNLSGAFTNAAKPLRADLTKLRASADTRAYAKWWLNTLDAP
jgi:hypothetical protein